MVPTVTAMSGASAGQARSANAGWLAGGLLILAVLLIGAAFWFHYHPW